MKLSFCLLAALAIASTNAASNCSDGCPDVMEEPVCDSDGVTYSNKCELGIASCKSDGNVTQVSEGRCPRLTFPPLPCDFACTQEFNPIDDEEGNTYSNKCELLLAQCEKDAGITRE